MGLRCTVGGARGTFEGPLAEEFATLLDQSFGADEEWESGDRSLFGELDATDWTALQSAAVATLGADALGNLLSLSNTGRGVFLPANVRTVSLSTRAGQTLRCASLPGLRRELFELADRWELPVDDEALAELLAEDDGPLALAPEHAAFARLMLASNEAMRRDCPLWLVG
jgi:hypothetical protein